MEDNALLTAAEAAERLRISPSWLSQARQKGTGPRFVKIGSAVRYSGMELDSWAIDQTRSKTGAGEMKVVDARQIDLEEYLAGNSDAAGSTC